MLALAALVASAVFKPLAAGVGYSQVQRESLLKTEQGWVLQFDMVNREGKDTRYGVSIVVAGQQFSESFAVEDGWTYTYRHHIRRDTVAAREVNIAVFRGDDNAPFRQVTYHLR